MKLFLPTVFLCLVLFCQTSTAQKVLVNSWDAGYRFHTFPWRPGLSVGTYHHLHSDTNSKYLNYARRKGKNSRIKYFVASTSWLWHRQNGIFATISAGYGVTLFRPKGLTFDFRQQLGYTRIFNVNDTYEVSAEGKVKRIPLAGSNYLSIQPAASIGMTLKSKYFHPFIFMRTEALVLLPYNGFLSIFPAAELGIRFWKKDPRRK